MTEPKAAKRPPSKGSKGSAPPSKAEPPSEAAPEAEAAPAAEAAPDAEPVPDAEPAAESPRNEQDRLREVNEQLRLERELAGKSREQELRRRR